MKVFTQECEEIHVVHFRIMYFKYLYVVIKPCQCSLCINVFECTAQRVPLSVEC